MLCFESVPYVAKPQAGDGPHYTEATIDYVKYFAQDMGKNENSQPKAEQFLQTVYKQSAKRFLAHDKNDCRNIAKRNTRYSIRSFLCKR